MTKLRPLNDGVILKRLEAEKKTASGIIIPDIGQERPDVGIVTAVGPGKQMPDGSILPMTVKIGDKVLFGKYVGQSVKVDGVDLLRCIEADLFAVIEESAGD